MFRLTIHTDSAAFDGADCGPELARILRGLADRLESGTGIPLGVLRDVNGNKVGGWTHECAEEEEEE
jgi:hypothetical protein